MHNGLSAHDVSEIADGVSLIIGLILRRGVYYAHRVLQKPAHVLFREGEGSHTLLDMIDPVLIYVLKAEALRRLGVGAREEAVNFAEHLVLCGAYLVRRRAGGGKAAQLDGADLEVAVKGRVHSPGVARLICLTVNVLRNDSVFADDVREHLPLAAVVHSRLEYKLHVPVVRRKGGGLDYRLKEEIAPLKFIPKGEIALAELEAVKLKLRRDAFAQHVRRGEEPAASAALLICYGQGLDIDGELLRHPEGPLNVVSRVVKVGLRKGEGGKPALRARRISSGPFFDITFKYFAHNDMPPEKFMSVIIIRFSVNYAFRKSRNSLRPPRPPL